MFSFHTKIYVDVIAIHVYIKQNYQKFAMLFLYFIIYFAWHSPPPWCISIVYVVVNQYSYLLNSSKFKMILSRFKKDMSTCNISKLPCKKYIISFLRLDMQRNHVDIQEKLKSFGFKKSEIINDCRHMTFNIPDTTYTYIYVYMQLINVDMHMYIYMWLAR